MFKKYRRFNIIGFKYNIALFVFNDESILNLGPLLY